jgi:hypothetical protein
MVLILVYGAETCRIKIWYQGAGKRVLIRFLLEPDI